MKVALLTHEYPPYPGGIGRYCLEVATAAQALGHSVEVFAPKHNADCNEALFGEVPVFRFNGDVFKFASIGSLVVSLRKMLSPVSYDIIHIADWPMLIAYNLAFPFCKTPITVTLHGTDVFTLSHSKKALALLSRLAFRRATHVCANSEYTLRLAKTHLRFNTAASSTVTYLAANEYWSQQPEAEEEFAFEEFVQAHGQIHHILTTVARIDSRKGHRNALLAIAKLPQHVRERTLYVAIGKIVDESLHAELVALSKELSVNAVFTGRQSDAFIRACYSRSSAFLLLAEPEERKIEGFGLVFLEAASQGLFSIASNVHAIPEVVKPGVTGALFNPHNHQAISEAILDHLAGAAGKHTRTEITKHAKSFSWQMCAARTYKLA